MRKFELRVEDSIVCDMFLPKEENPTEEDMEGTGLLYIPEEVTGLNTDCVWINQSRFSGIEVAENNPVYYAKDNCLFYKENDVLVLGSLSSVLPADGSFHIIGANAFSGFTETEFPFVKQMVIPEGVEDIQYNAIMITREDDTEVLLPGSLKHMSILAMRTQSDNGHLTLTFLSDPKLETGVFGTKKELLDIPEEDHPEISQELVDVLKNMPDTIYARPETYLVRAGENSSVEQYCKKYDIPFERI